MADNIRAALKKKGWSALELDRKAGLKRGRTNNIFRRRLPESDAITAIARALGVTVEQLSSRRVDQPVVKEEAQEYTLMKTRLLSRLKDLIAEIETNWPD